MLGHNPYTGITCFFQNALYSRRDGLHVPHPADTVDSPQSPQQTTSLWSGIQGGIGSGIGSVRGLVDGGEIGQWASRLGIQAGGGLVVRNGRLGLTT